MNADERSELGPSDPLDELLSQAKWPAVEPARVERLKAFYLGRRRGGGRRYIGLLAAAAAMILVASTAAVWMRSEKEPVAKAKPAGKSSGEQSSDVVKDRQTEEPNSDLPPKEQTPAERMTPPDSRPATAVASSRRPEVSEPNRYEQLVAMGARPRGTKREPMKTDPGVSSALLALSEDEADIEQIVAKYLKAGGEQERQLAVLARDASSPERRSAVMLLLEIATWRSLPTLRELYGQADYRLGVSLRFAQLSDPQALWPLIRQEQDPAVLTRLIAGLLDRQDVRAVELYLNAVEDSLLTDAAAASLSLVESPPVDRLFERLQDSRVSRRMAAAKTLGRLNDAAVTNRLVTLAQSGTGRREAIVALLHSRHPLAIQFLQHAQRDLNLMASVHAAQVRFPSPWFN